MSALRVAIVGSGPAGAYAAGHLLSLSGDAEVAMFDRLPTPWGLVRAGVAPDHPETKAVARMFEWTAGAPRFGFHLNVEVGRDVSHDELLAHHHAVVYAVGAPGNRRLGIEGEDLPGSHPATDFVGWYNGHPDHRALSFDLSSERALIIGNGNVALDVARILTLGVDELRRTDIADHALEALAESAIEEVVVLGRRGPAQAALTTPELLALASLPDVDVVVDPDEARLDEHSEAWLRNGAGFGPRMKARLIGELAGARPKGRRRIVLRFLASPLEIVGGDRVEGVRFGRNKLERADGGRLSARPTGDEELLEAGLVLRSIGYAGREVAGVPFDADRSVMPHEGGRVVGAPGTYATGWIKRGPTGVIGTNKHCARETVDTLLADHAAGRLRAPSVGAAELGRLLADRRVDRRGWLAIDAHERRAGAACGRPRVKLTDVDEMVQVAGGSS